MQVKIIEFGTKHKVIVDSADKTVIICHAPKINEGFLLMFHGLETLPSKGDKGTIIFEKDSNRGHWQYYPDKK